MVSYSDIMIRAIKKSDAVIYINIPFTCIHTQLTLTLKWCAAHGQPQKSNRATAISHHIIILFEHTSGKLTHANSTICAISANTQATAIAFTPVCIVNFGAKANCTYEQYNHMCEC